MLAFFIPSPIECIVLGVIAMVLVVGIIAFAVTWKHSLKQSRDGLHPNGRLMSD